MKYIVRQAHPAGGSTGCFGRRDCHPSGKLDLVCPLCAHETGDATRLTARLSVSRYIQCESCHRHSAVYTDEGTTLVPGPVAYNLLTGLDNLPATRHALVLEGDADSGVLPASLGDCADLVAALHGNGQLLQLLSWEGEEDALVAADAVSRRGLPIIRASEAMRRLADLGEAAPAATTQTSCFPREVRRLMKTA
jgi:hypothetical protein